jgi:phosphate acyltransferase
MREKAARRRALTRASRKSDGSPEEEDLEGKEQEPSSFGMGSKDSRPFHLPAVPARQAAPHRLSELRLVQGPSGDRDQLTLPVAVDALGGDKAPGEIVAGALAARAAGVPVVLVGPTDGSLGDTGDLEIIEANEVIGMDEDAARSVRSKKDSTLVRAAEAVRDGRASAMVSAGNTGATMASALLRMGRISGVARPAIATPLPVPGGTPTVLIDAGANAECQAEWLVQFAQMAAVYMRQRYGNPDPSVALLSIGEESSKGNPLVKEAHAIFAEGIGVRFIGNVEGRDLLTGQADIIVTDGFTGNVALKALEGALQVFMGILMSAIGSTPETKSAGDVLIPALLPHAANVDPEATGGAMLLGVDGVCIISHGSSSARAITNAVQVAHDMAEGDLVGHIRAAISR